MSDKNKQAIIAYISERLRGWYDWMDTGNKETCVGLEEYFGDGGEPDADEDQIIIGGTTEYFETEPESKKFDDYEVLDQSITRVEEKFDITGSYTGGSGDHFEYTFELNE